MALIMVFSNKEQAMCRQITREAGFDCYQTDNIYQFLCYAKEAKPDVVMMHFSADFNTDSKMMEEIKKALCENNVCPRIFLNRPHDFDADIFFENTDFEKDDMPKLLH